MLSGMSSLCVPSRTGNWMWSLSFLDQLYSCEISHGNIDHICWSHSKKGKFKVKLFYKALFNLDHEVFPWKSIWRTEVPTRVAFFGWNVTFGKILTHDNLRKRNIVVVEWCYMCKKNGKSVDLYFTVRWLVLSGILSLVILGCIGLCLAE